MILGRESALGREMFLLMNLLCGNVSEEETEVQELVGPSGCWRVFEGN